MSTSLVQSSARTCVRAACDLGQDEVIARLEVAHGTLALLPAKRWPQGYRLALGGFGSAMPVEKRHDLPAPTSRAINQMSEALGWLDALAHKPVRVRRAVALRSRICTYTGRHLYNWRRLGKELGVSKDTARKLFFEGIAAVVHSLRGDTPRPASTRRRVRPAVALAAACALAPSLAVASGNNLTMTGATYDTTTPLHGTGALNGGYGLTPAGACYNNPSVFGVAGSGNPPPGQGISFSKVVWVKAPTTAPSSDQLIFGDAAGYIAENPAAYPAFGAGLAFISENNTAGLPNQPLTDGKWHRLEINVTGINGGGLYGAFIISASFDQSGDEFGPVASPGPLFANLSALQNMVTGIGSNPNMTAQNGNPLTNCAGEIDEATCFNPGEGPDGIESDGDPFTGSEMGVLGLWHLDGNGNDSSTYVYSAPPAPTASSPPSNVITNQAPTPNFPLLP